MIEKDPYPWDLNLKKAMMEIKEILLKYDIAGHIALISPTHSEFLFHPMSTWNALKQKGEDITLKVKSSEMQDKEKARDLIEKSAWTILGIRDLCDQAASFCNDFEKMLKTQVPGLEHKAFTNFTPHEEH